MPAFDSAKDGSDSNAIILPGKRMNKKKGKTKVYGTKCLYLTRSPILVHRIWVGLFGYPSVGPWTTDQEKTELDKISEKKVD